MIQCATCIHEQAARQGYGSLHPQWSQTMTNISLMEYQKFARKYQCGDYFRAWQQQNNTSSRKEE
jgi:hypothetical protein